MVREGAGESLVSRPTPCRRTPITTTASLRFEVRLGPDGVQSLSSRPSHSEAHEEASISEGPEASAWGPAVAPHPAPVLQGAARLADADPGARDLVQPGGDGSERARVVSGDPAGGDRRTCDVRLGPADAAPALELLPDERLRAPAERAGSYSPNLVEVRCSRKFVYRNQASSDSSAGDRLRIRVRTIPSTKPSSPSAGASSPR
jgi:hypothetical protein